MSKDFARSFYSSQQWIKTRNAYFESQHGLCEGEGCSEAGLIVHHLIELIPHNITDPNITLNWDLLQLTCQRCHNQIHHGSNQPIIRDGLMFNASGELVQAYEGE